MSEPALAPEIQEFLARPTTRHFLSVAQLFLDLVEFHYSDKVCFLCKAHSFLAEVYSAGLELEEIDLKYSTAHELFEEEKAGWLLVNGMDFGKLMGEEGNYWELENPLGTSTPRLIPGSLAADFTDIYRDLKFELHKIQHNPTNESVEDGLWTLKLGFFHSWGHHCMNALRALHYMGLNDSNDSGSGCPKGSVQSEACRKSLEIV